jgi:hypothetical protein
MVKMTSVGRDETGSSALRRRLSARMDFHNGCSPAGRCPKVRSARRAAERWRENLGGASRERMQARGSADRTRVTRLEDE